MAAVVLVGLPATGKTTTGRALAAATGLSFVDTDDLFFEMVGVRVPEYLRGHDEADFRAREVGVLAAALRDYDVVATGGGVVCTPAGRALLAAEATWWLDCPDEVIVARAVAGDRPLLGADPEGRLRELRAQREEYYREVSRERLDAAQATESLVERLRAALSEEARP